MISILMNLLMSTVAVAQVGGALDRLPVQDAGRLKPFDTFARESLRLVYGKEKYEGKPATEVVFTWMLIPDHWATVPMVEVRNAGVRKALNISGTEIRFSPQSLLANDRLPLLFQELQSKRSRQEKLNPYFQDVQRLENQLGLFHAVRSGEAIRVAPDPNSDKWKAVSELPPQLQEGFAAISKNFVEGITAAQENKGSATHGELGQAVSQFIEKARAEAPDKYADLARIDWEVHFNHFHPFMWAWIAYLLAAFCIIIFMAYEKPVLHVMSWVFLLGGFFLHLYGMGLRVYLAGRPPVSNMYETVVWVSFGAVLFGIILERVLKIKLLTVAAACVAVFCLILTDLAPTVLDSSIQPLEPVLRSTFWLSSHVLIISISYAAFFLAFALGDLLLFYYLKDENRYHHQIAQGTRAIYRSIQIGVVLVAAGTILGGIWADYSWGRFWGWDPKETWALIVCLGYLALLHGRYAGWVKNFELAAGAVVAFSLVIMAWYGVNYVLGAGLHSYGFGAGGVEYVTGFVIAHLLYVTYVSTVRYGREKTKS